jgi:hypothetical protein
VLGDADRQGGLVISTPEPHSPLEEELADEAAHAPSRRAMWVRRTVILALCLLAGYVLVDVVARFDWAAVWDAVTELTWWQAVVLFAALMVRQTLNALPLAFFIRGLSVYRAVVNDLAAHLLAVAVPPPGDLVLRIGMFTSWGLDASKAAAGSMMNMISFYMIRFSIPVVGVLILLPVRFDAGYAVTAVLSGAVAAAIVVAVVLGLRSEAFARRLGHLAGTLVSKVRRSVQPARWVDATVQFRLDMLDTYASGFPRSAFALVGLVFADATVLLLALRFVGVSASEWPAIELYAAFLCVYPLTLFPFMGLGLVDAVLLATIVDTAGSQTEAAAVAGLVVWRAYTLAGPIILGAGSLGLWRHGLRRRARSTAEAA